MGPTANQIARRKEERRRSREQKLSQLSPFARMERLEPFKPYVPKNLTNDQRERGVFVYFDFENGRHDFPPMYDLRSFRKDLRKAICWLLNKDIMVLGIFGAGTFTAFNDVQHLETVLRHESSGYILEDLTARSSKCGCGAYATHGNTKIRWNYERVTDRACDIISEEMSFYPTSVGHTRGQHCNILLISLDRDFKGTICKLRNRGVNVMLAYTGDKVRKPTEHNLLGSVSAGNVMRFKNVFRNWGSV